MARSVRRLLSDGLSKIRAQKPSIEDGGRSAVIIAVAAQKGGVGKTTTAVNLACALVKFHHLRVLLIDMDPQGHVVASLREIITLGGLPLSEILLSEAPRDVYEAARPTKIEGLYITPADKRLNETETLLSTRLGREHILQNAIKGARTHFDVILIDCPPNLGNLTLNALVAADYALVPCDLSILAFEGVADILRTLETVQSRLHHDVDLLGILRTRVDVRTRSLNATIGRGLEESYGPLLFETRIPANSALTKAQAVGRSVLDYQARSRGAAAYQALAAEVLARLEAEA
ncbi:ParA family protein [Myxococcota bacterium]|nr:ParA family protein [Myxococcota bacterium]MBU1431912.1 ParA family protein [Myxococcota bacterium]MBU1900422.1 ParA family protein [Myxococcota bacterium]